MQAPCPFCKHERSAVPVEFEPGRWAMVCEVCGATGPQEADATSATDRWLAARPRAGLGAALARLLGIGAG